MWLVHNICMEKIIYLDNAATTKPFEESLQIYEKSLVNFYNPSAAYRQAILVKKELDNARNEISSLIGGRNGKILFTSSATEANNMVFEGLHLRKGQVVLVSKAEHPAVYEAAHRLEKNGIIVKDIPLAENGRVNFEEFQKMMTAEVALVSVIHTSNETGVVNDIKTLCGYVKKTNPKVIFHSDGVQAFGKIKVNLQTLGVDLYTISGHKIYAPRGIAALWIKQGVVIDPLLVGGGQENGLRSSTENVFGALALAYSAKKVVEHLEENNAKIIQKRRNLINLLTNSEICCVFSVNEAGVQSPYILSISLKDIKGEVLIHSLEDDGILVSTGSACSSKKAGNRMLEAMGKTTNEIVGSIRISFSAYEDFDEKYVADSIIKNVVRFEKNLKNTKV